MNPYRIEIPAVNLPSLSVVPTLHRVRAASQRSAQLVAAWPPSATATAAGLVAAWEVKDMVRVS